MDLALPFVALRLLNQRLCLTAPCGAFWLCDRVGHDGWTQRDAHCNAHPTLPYPATPLLDVCAAAYAGSFTALRLHAFPPAAPRRYPTTPHCSNRGLPLCCRLHGLHSRVFTASSPDRWLVAHTVRITPQRTYTLPFVALFTDTDFARALPHARFTHALFYTPPVIACRAPLPRPPHPTAHTYHWLNITLPLQYPMPFVGYLLTDWNDYSLTQHTHLEGGVLRMPCLDQWIISGWWADMTLRCLPACRPQCHSYPTPSIVQEHIHGLHCIPSLYSWRVWFFACVLACLATLPWGWTDAHPHPTPV